MAAMVKSVEFIEVTQSTTISHIDLTKNQNYNNCVPFMTLHGCGDYMDSHCQDVWFSGTVASGIINFQRNETRSCNMYIKCYVVEFDPAEVNVQQGSFSALPAGTTTYYTTPESFVKNKTAMVHYWWSTSGSNRWDIHLVRGRVDSSNNGTQVDMYRNEAGGTVSGHYFLFEDISAGNDHLIVSHQNSSYTGTSSNRSIPVAQADPTRTFLIGSFACSDGGTAYADRQTARIFTYFRAFSRCDRANGTGTIWYNIQHVTFQDQTRVYVPFQHYTGFSTTQTTITNGWTRPCNTNLSTIIATVPMGISRGSTTSASETDSLWCSMKITGSTGAQFQRNSVGSNSASYFGYSIVDWGGAVVSTGSNPTPIDPNLSCVKSVENFRMSVPAYQAQRDLSKGQVVANCAVFASQRNSGGAAQTRESLHDVWIREPGVVVAHRTDAGGTGVVDVSVVEFYPDQVKVQMGHWSHWSTGTETTTIEAVSNTDKAFVIAKWEANEATYWSRVAIRIRFTATNTIEFYRHDAGNMIGGTFFVIEDLADNFRVDHYITSGTTTTSFYDNDYHGYYECLNISSYANSNDAYYVDRGCSRSYQTGNGGRAVIQKYNSAGTGYSSFMWVRFLDQRRHTSPFASTMNTSTSVITTSLPADFTAHKDLSVSLYNSMQICTGRGNTTGADDMRAVFVTYRLTTDNTIVEQSRETPTGVTLNPSYGGVIDWIGYTHPDADEDHQITYATPTQSLVRSVEKFAYTGGSRILLQYLRKGQRPENCVPFSSKRIGANANETDRLMRFQYIDKNSKMTSVGEGAGSGGNLDEITYVVEFDPAQVRVQKIWKMMTGTSVNVTIPQEVDLTKTFMVFGYTTDNWGNRWDFAAVTGSFVSSTQLNFSRYASSAGVYICAYLVECLQDQWFVTHKDGGTDTDTNSYDYVNWKQSSGLRMIQGSYSMTNANYYGDRNCYRLYPNQLQGYQWNRNNTTGSQSDRHLEVVEFHPDTGVKVSGYFIDMTGITSETKGILFDGGFDLDRSITFPSIQNSINRVDGTGADDLGSSCVKLEITDANTVTCTRYDKGIYTYGYGQVIEWPAFKTHYFEGTVSERNVPISRPVACFRADTDEIMDSTVSASGTGFYHLETTYSGVHYIVCQDDDPPVDYNHLILGKMEPYPIV